jgi:hypothetical protein
MIGDITPKVTESNGPILFHQCFVFLDAYLYLNHSEFVFVLCIYSKTLLTWSCHTCSLTTKYNLYQIIGILFWAAMMDFL